MHVACTVINTHNGTGRLWEITGGAQHPMHTWGLTWKRITGWLRLCRWVKGRESPGRTATMKHKLHSHFTTTAGICQQVQCAILLHQGPQGFQRAGFLLAAKLQGIAPLPEGLLSPPTDITFVLKYVTSTAFLCQEEIPGSLCPNPIPPLCF